MEVIVVSHLGGKTWRLPKLGVALLSGAALSLMLTVGIAVGRANSGPTTLLAPEMAKTLQTEITQQRQLLIQARASAEQTNSALSQRMATLSAQMVRLDAASERMVTLAKLDPGEFRFGDASAVGGPEEDAIPDAAPTPLLAQVDQLERNLSDRERQLRVLEDLLAASRANGSVKPSGWPVQGGYISSVFGYRADPFSGHSAFHEGIDFAAPYGSDVYAVAAGVVSFAGERAGYGGLVEINHGNGYVTRYGHNSAIKVKVGDSVRKNQVISAIGSTGRSTGPHVHFEVLINGSKVNPASYVQASQ